MCATGASAYAAAGPRPNDVTVVFESMRVRESERIGFSKNLARRGARQCVDGRGGHGGCIQVTTKRPARFRGDPRRLHPRAICTGANVFPWPAVEGPSSARRAYAA